MSGAPAVWPAVATTGAAYVALAIAVSWPLATALSTVVPADLGDPLLNTWILWWTTSHLPLTEGWWNAPAFFPALGTLAFSEHLLGLWPIAAPVTWITGSPVAGYNVVFLLTFVLSASAAFLLVLDLTGRRDAALLAGLAFGFSPYRIAQWSHVQVLAAFWMPIALLGLHRFARSGGVRWWALFAGAFLMQALTNGYYLVFGSLLAALAVAWCLAIAGWRRAVALASGWVVALALLSPVLLTYRDVHARYGLTRNLEHMRMYSADVISVFSASPNLAIWRSLPPARNAETALFPGFIVLALFVAGAVLLCRRERPVTGATAAVSPRATLALYVGASLAMYVLALGPSPRLTPASEPGWSPYGWLAGLPGFASLRAPGRFGMFFVLCAAVASAIAFARLTREVGRAARWAAACLLAIAMTAEAWPKALPLWTPPQASGVRAEHLDGPLLVLPILNEFNELAAMYRAIAQGQPLVNGYSGHIPPWYLALREALNLMDPRMLDELSRHGVRHVSVMKRQDDGGDWRRFVATRATPVLETDDAVLFTLDAPPTRHGLSAVVPIARAWAAPHPDQAPLMLDGRPETYWYTEEPQRGSEQIGVDLAGLHLVAGVDMTLGSGYEFPRMLLVDVSIDGVTWQSVWSGSTAALAAGSAMRGFPPSIRLEFDRRPARSLRLRQIGRHLLAPWRVVELRVLGP